jgi:hypothetical protein
MPTPTPEPVAQSVPAAAPAAAPAPSRATCGRGAQILSAPDQTADVVGDVEAAESVEVLGRAPLDDWLYVRSNAGVEGFVWLPYFNWFGDFHALPVQQLPDAWAWLVTDSGQGAFALEYLGCIPHDFELGSVKGQVFDRAGNVIHGAQVEMWLNGSRWDDSANPAATNEDGWYEWIIVLDQGVQLSALFVDGRRVSFSPRDLVVITKRGCFHHINFIQR